MTKREHFLFRAACLRDAQRSITDPLARWAFEASIEALEEAAAEAERRNAN
jgi:hypothetical protein